MTPQDDLAIPYFLERMNPQLLEKTMTEHRVPSRTVTIAGDIVIDIKYWADERRIYVAGFDEFDNQVTAATYSAEVEMADDFYGAFKEALIESLTGTVESDLQNNPTMHYKPPK